jgi:3-hydroxyacyl-CoA dehydrogenase/enoyl-CoA hydratase/3-hydroxybutyryl-CoA epimerase
MSAPQILTLEFRADGVAVVTIDVPGESQNTLQSAFMGQFDDAFARIRENATVKAIVIRSGKPGSFIAGADIRMIDGVTSAAEAEALSRDGQSAFDRLEDSPVPVVAAIDGACLGGGLELALACHARVAADTSATQLGLPEVQLGLLPGAGGTQRLPRLLGLATSLDLMLTGKRLKPKKALKLGLVDEVVPAAILMQAAVARALQLADSGRALARTPKTAKGFAGLQASIQTAVLEKNPFGRKLLFSQARKKLLEKTFGNYPAAERIIDVVEAGANGGFQVGLEAERRHFGDLAMSPQSHALRHIFHSMTALKADNGTSDASVKARPVARIGMLGAGFMGAGIANVSITKADIPVRFRERDAEGLQRGFSHVHAALQKSAKRGSISAREAERQFRQLTGAVDWSGFEATDLIIEAVFEDLTLKHRMLQEAEKNCAKGVIFASNTSSIPISRIAEAAQHPENIIGMHYFSPVEKMPLLEIIVTPQTSPEVIATCVEVGKRQGKTVIVVNDGVGFYTSRILAPYMNEAAYLLSEGVPVERLDYAAQKWGFPVGPITLLDEVGIDVAAKVGPIMVDAFGSRLSPPGTTDALVRDGRLGRKNGKGFYLYGKNAGKKKQVDPTVYGVLGISPSNDMDLTLIAERMGLQMVNEALLCLQEGILRSPRDGDIGAVFGLGFPPAKGGPFHYIDQIGAAHVLNRLQQFEDQYGHRFTPAQILVDYARDGRLFYPRD